MNEGYGRAGQALGGLACGSVREFARRDGVLYLALDVRRKNHRTELDRTRNPSDRDI